MSTPFDTQTAVSATTTARVFQQIAPSDSTDIAEGLKALYVNADGVAVLQDWQGNVVNFQVTAGQVLPVLPRRVLATGTSATLIGLWS